MDKEGWSDCMNAQADLLMSSLGAHNVSYVAAHLICVKETLGRLYMYSLMTTF